MRAAGFTGTAVATPPQQGMGRHQLPEPEQDVGGDGGFPAGPMRSANRGARCVTVKAGAGGWGMVAAGAAVGRGWSR